MPKIRNLAALAAAIEAARRYARSNPDKAAQYLDQAAAFVDKQTKGKYSSHVHGAADKVKSVAGLPNTTTTKAYETNVGYGERPAYGAPDPVTTRTPPPVPPTPAPAPPVSTPPTRAAVDPELDRTVPGSKDL